jgi:hypothetical protein
MSYLQQTNNCERQLTRQTQHFPEDLDTNCKQTSTTLAHCYYAI